jgi:Ca2+-binding RTX toxin-like protein
VTWVSHAKLATAGPGRTVHAVGSASPPARPAHFAARQPHLGPGRPTPVDPTASRQSPEQPKTTVSAPTDFDLFRGTDLGSGLGSLIDAPSVATNGIGVLQTWNWFAARSLNGGATFDYLNPFTLFPASYGGFCCGQVVQYDPSRDLYIWVLQYSPDGSGNNALRIAVAHGQAGLAAGLFTYWDVGPDRIGSPSGQFFDLPKIALTNDNLFLTASVYASGTGAWQRSAVMRISLDDLATGHAPPLPFVYFIPGEFSPGLTQGATTTMYIGTHIDNSQLKVYSWADGSLSIPSYSVAHHPYPIGLPQQCLRTGAPASANWCEQGDDRLPNGWVSQGKIGFAWTASQGTAPGGFGTFPYPYVHVVRIDETAHTLIDEPIIWNPSLAFAYPSIAPNARGDLGGTVLWGGGANYENCGGLVRDSTSGNLWGFLPITSSTADPSAPEGGNFLSTRKNGGNSNIWSGGCYTVTGAGTNSGVHTYFLSFGREADSPPAAPTNVHALAGSSYTATVSWSPPAPNGGRAVTNYVVTPYFGSTAFAPKTVGNVTSTTYPGLGNGARFTFKVAAVNADGTGPSSSSSNAIAYCVGKPATIVGTDGPDPAVTGTSNPDVIATLGGDDHIEGGGNGEKDNDLICGGSGNDTILGQGGTDQLFGAAGDDTIDGGTGFTDVISGGPGNDSLTGNEFAAVSYLSSLAGVNVNLANGTATGDGSDTIHGIQNVFGSNEKDTLVASDQGSFMAGFGGNDTIDGGKGFDAILFVQSATANLAAGTSSGPQEGTDTLHSIEGIAGGKTSTENYQFTGDAGDNLLFTTSVAPAGAPAPTAPDTLNGGGGADTLVSDTGNDQLNGGSGNDVLEAGPGTNQIDGGPGNNDQVSYEWSPANVKVDLGHHSGQSADAHDTFTRVESATGSSYADTLRGSAAPNQLFGDDGNDKLFGLGGGDFLDGGAGSDHGDGGPGKDFCLDVEHPTRCESRSKSSASFSEVPEIPRILKAGLLQPGPGLKPVSLGKLAKTDNEPTCQRGVTTITPPATIYAGSKDDHVEWQAWLYRGSKKVFTSPKATAKLRDAFGHLTQHPGQSGGWTDANRNPVKEVPYRAKQRGTYHWVEQVRLPGSARVAKDKLPYYFKPKGALKPNKKPCKF